MQTDKYFKNFLSVAGKNSVSEIKAHGILCSKLSKKILRDLLNYGFFEDEKELLLKYQNLLEYASILHDIGNFIKGEKPHNKKGAKYILENKIDFLTDEENLITALVIRYHRGKAPKEKHKLYSSCSFDVQNIIKIYSAILRIADALDYNHFSCSDDISLNFEENVKNLIIEVNSNIILNIGFNEVFDKKKKLLEKLTDTKITIKPL